MKRVVYSKSNVKSILRLSIRRYCFISGIQLGGYPDTSKTLWGGGDKPKLILVRK